MIRPDTPAALDFLNHWQPAGPWTLSAIEPVRDGGIETRTFAGTDDVTRWIDQWQGKRNLYFSVNQPKLRTNKKAGKADIGLGIGLHVDLDARPGADLSAAKTALIAKLQDFRPRATAIINSGGGAQGFWRLREPPLINGPDSVAAFEARNRSIQNALDGDHCFNIDRIMRLPGTVNLPDELKRAKGRQVCLARLVEANWDRLYDIDEFEPEAAPNGYAGNGSGHGDTSRSAAAFRLGAAMRRAGKTFEEMVEALFADPETADWARTKGQASGGREFRRIWDKAAPDDDALPTITVRAGLRHEAAEAGLAALEAVGAAFYQRGEQIVRVLPLAAKTADGGQTTAPGIAAVSCAVLGRELGRAARWEGLDRKGDPVRIDPPRPVVEQIAEMVGEWPFPILAGVIGTPTMRADGSLLLDEGYDEQTGLVLLGAPALPPIPEEPTRADAIGALLVLDTLLDEFPFKDGGGPKSIDRAVALSELITPVLRGAMSTAPMHLANAPQPGTGKSYLADLTSCVSTGERCAVVAFSPNPEETEKRLNGSALGGHPILALDNASGTIEGDLLCQLTERPLLQLRPLGTSKMARCANTFTVLANGNNAEVAADMVRRTIECRLDANMEAPEARTFRRNPLATITRNRGVYIAAALTVARAYLRAGKPGRLPPLASYEAWSDLVRSPLVWLDRADPVASMASLRSVDPVRLARAALFHAWADELGTGGAYQTADVINRANDQSTYGAHLRPALRAALLDIGRDRIGNIEARQVGKWLSKNENNIADGLKLTCDRGDAARPRWVLRDA